jgi:hypothetical protein
MAGRWERRGAYLRDEVARRATRIAVTLWSLDTVVALVTVVLLGRTAAVVEDPIGDLSFAVALLVLSLAFVTVGCFLASRLPSHPFGWLLAGWGTVMVVTAPLTVYQVLVLASGPPTDVLVWLGWIWVVLWHPAFALLFFALLLFPDGRLPSPGWRRLAVVAAWWYVLLAVAIAFATEGPFPDSAPPAAIPTTHYADLAVGVLLPGQLGLVLLAMVSLVLRLRGANGPMRTQIAWFVYAVVMSVAAFVLGVLLFGDGVLFPVFVAIPLAAGYAVLRERLYDIDRVVRRTVSYALVAGILTGVYALAVVGLQYLVPNRGSDLVVAASTLLIAALFRPVRHRVQQRVDRRFNRSHYDASALVARFGSRLRDEVDLATVSAALRETAATSVQPLSTRVWLSTSARSGAVPAGPSHATEVRS